jgi:hypothetical protein
MASKRKISHVFNNNPQGTDWYDDQKTDGGTVCKQILIDTELKTGKRDQKTSDWKKSIKEAGVCIGL